MRFRAGLLVGFTVGFYLGAMAGRERYEQINRSLRQMKRPDAFGSATGTARSAMDQGVERAKGFAVGRFGKTVGDGGGTTDAGPPAPSTAHRGMTGPPSRPDAGEESGSDTPGNGPPST
jgi:hypothetical protein